MAMFILFEANDDLSLSSGNAYIFMSVFERLDTSFHHSTWDPNSEFILNG